MGEEVADSIMEVVVAIFTEEVVEECFMVS
jgi:hypothetical protein